jgi:hypothetical protein
MLKTIIMLWAFSMGLLAVPTVYPMDVTLESEMEVIEPMNVTVYPIDENQTEVSNREVSQEVSSNEIEENSVNVSAISFLFVSFIFSLFLFRKEI